MHPGRPLGWTYCLDLNIGLGAISVSCEYVWLEDTLCSQVGNSSGNVILETLGKTKWLNNEILSLKEKSQ